MDEHHRFYTEQEGAAAPEGTARNFPSDQGIIRCPTCLESIGASLEKCPECGEPISNQSDPVSPRWAPSIVDYVPGSSWLAMHWRPLITITTMLSLLFSGVALRYLAPDRFSPPRASSRSASVSPVCTDPCWNGEACQVGQCVWQKPGNVGHVAADPHLSGPFTLPKDVSDGLALDAERFAIALLTGVQIHRSRTGEVLTLISDAPQPRRLLRVGEVIYATSLQRIYVIDPDTTRLLKTIEIGTKIDDVTVGASGRRALAALSSAHAVAILATDYHAEIDRIQFGDDAVGPIGVDDTGKRALTTTGQVPLPGLRDAPGGAVYAFDPSRLASEQDRVRASMPGNPVSVLTTPDGTLSYVVLRAEDVLVPLEWLPSGAVRQRDRVATCREPEQIELVRKGRRAIVRCNQGRALEVFDVTRRELLRHIPFNARAVDLAISPDGEQAIVALTSEGTGSIAFVDLETYSVKLVAVGAEPTRVRISPDGSAVFVLSDRAKVAWVLR